MKPTINLSGDDPEDMLIRLRDVVVACNILISMMQRCNPHPRNYPKDDNGYFRDRDAWTQNEAQVRNIIKDAEWTMDHILEQER